MCWAGSELGSEMCGDENAVIYLVGRASVNRAKLTFIAAQWHRGSLGSFPPAS